MTERQELPAQEVKEMPGDGEMFGGKQVGKQPVEVGGLDGVIADLDGGRENEGTKKVGDRWT